MNCISCQHICCTHENESHPKAKFWCELGCLPENNLTNVCHCSCDRWETLETDIEYREPDPFDYHANDLHDTGRF